MKAAVWHGRGDVRVEAVPDPGSPGPREVIIRVACCGICGTDLEEYRSGPHNIPVGRPHALTGKQAPLILGHEFAGEVVEIGRAVTGLRPGDRVAPDTILYCGRCFWCSRHQYVLCEHFSALGLMRDGGLATYCAAPGAMCLRIPGHMSFEAAALAEPTAVAVRAVRRSALQIGERVAIVGGGTIGLLVLQVAQAAGAGEAYVIEPSEFRRHKAHDLGATATLDPHAADVQAELLDLTGGIGPDLVIECAGAPQTAAHAIRWTRRGGRTVLVGYTPESVPLDLGDFLLGEKQVLASLSHIYDEDYAVALRLLADGRIEAEPLISHRIPIDRIVSEGFDRLTGEQREETLKVLVLP